MADWIPTQDRILVTVDDKENQTSTGIFVAGDGDTNFDTGEIIAIGQLSDSASAVNGERPHAELKIGRRAMFYKEQGLPVPLNYDDGKTYAVLHVNDIYFVSDNPDASIRGYYDS